MNNLPKSDNYYVRQPVWFESRLVWFWSLITIQLPSLRKKYLKTMKMMAMLQSWNCYNSPHMTSCFLPPDFVQMAPSLRVLAPCLRPAIARQPELTVSSCKAHSTPPPPPATPTLTRMKRASCLQHVPLCTFWQLLQSSCFFVSHSPPPAWPEQWSVTTSCLCISYRGSIAGICLMHVSCIDLIKWYKLILNSFALHFSFRDVINLTN